MVKRDSLEFWVRVLILSIKNSREPERPVGIRGVRDVTDRPKNEEIVVVVVVVIAIVIVIVIVIVLLFINHCTFSFSLFLSLSIYIYVYLATKFQIEHWDQNSNVEVFRL